MPKLIRRGLVGAYVVVVVAVVAAVSAELALRVNRARVRSLVDDHRQHNVFGARETVEAFAEDLWEIPWQRYRPHSSFVFQPEGGDPYEVRINSMGFRTREFAMPKGGTLRVICIGGSTTVQGVTNDQTYPALLEQELRSRYPGRNIEVLNFGISGTHSWHWADLVDSLVQYQPDLVIQHNAVNDLMWRYLGQYRQGHRWRALLNRSLLVHYLVDLDVAAFDPYFQHTLDQFVRMRRALEEHGIGYIVGSFPAPDYGRATRSFQAYLDADMAAWGKAMRLRRYRDYARLLERYNHRFVDVATQEGLRHAPVDELITDPAVFIDLCHMKPDGIRQLALAFLPHVERWLAEQDPPAPRS